MVTANSHGAPPSDPPVAAWLTHRTYSRDSFDAATLAAAKGSRTISVVLPAKNEEATVGAIVSALRRDLVSAVPLVDELVVVDSHSTDRTAEVAAAAGARVVAQSEVLPETGDRAGKGEALWKGLAATTGDLVVFLDADLRDFDTAFVTGLLGPLLTADGVEFVKGCYERPLDDGHTVHPTGGGRVTELVARPLLAMFWPALSGFVQPLAGEYAATRTAFESVPFAGAYGVELGLLIDLYESRGLDALAQVDLGVRKHRNSPDAALARMAMQQHQVVYSRLSRDGRSPGLAEPGTILTAHRRAPSGGFRQVTHDVVPTERPPLAELRATAAGG